MLKTCLILSAMLMLPESVDVLALESREPVVDAEFEKTFDAFHEAIDAKDPPSKEPFNEYARQQTQTIYDRLGKVEFFAQACVYSAKQAIEAKRSWPSAMLALFVFGDVYADEQKMLPEYTFRSLGPYWSLKDFRYRDFFLWEILEHSANADDFRRIESLLRERWVEKDPSYNGLIDCVFAVDAFEGWRLWHTLIGTTENDRAVMLQQMEKVKYGYINRSTDESDGKRFYEAQGVEDPLKVNEGLQLLREFISEGGLPEKVFVAAILERAPVFRAKDIVASLQEEEHPFIKVRLRYLDEDEE